MSPVADVVAHNLQVDHVTAEVVDALAAEEIACILLKGPPIVRWLYRTRPRRYQDCDLLLDPADRDRADEVLRRLGFSPQFEQSTMPSWWQEHALEWRHPKRFAPVDVHRSFKGVGVDDDELWGVLRAHTETIEVGGSVCTTLTPPARCLLLALQVAGDGLDKGDLRRAVEIADAETWRAATRLAARVGATEAFAAGIRLAPTGHRLAAELGLSDTRSVDVALRASRGSAEALTVDRLTRATSARERLSIARHKLFPSPSFMRHWSPAARRGRAALALAYVRRWIWVGARLPAAVRGWRAARRSARRESAPPV